MFELIWDAAPGPRWAKVVQMIALVAVCVALLVLVVYPAIFDWREAAVMI